MFTRSTACYALILLSIELLAGCGSKAADSLPPRHARLLGFKSVFIADEGDEAAHRKPTLTSKLQRKSIDVKQFRDILYISLPCYANACGSYDGNIRISHDTIYLNYNLTSDEVCASGRIDQLTYLVDNPKRLSYKVIYPK